MLRIIRLIQKIKERRVEREFNQKDLSDTIQIWCTEKQAFVGTIYIKRINGNFVFYIWGEKGESYMSEEFRDRSYTEQQVRDKCPNDPSLDFTFKWLKDQWETQKPQGEKYGR